MPVGRPPKTIEQKRRTGNPGKRPLPSGLAAVPAVPLEIHEYPAAETLERVLENGRAWLAATDSVAVAMLRESLEERSALREVVLAGGGTEARRSLRELDKQIIGLLAQLGFDPAARSRLGLAEVKAASKLEQLRRSSGNA